MGTMYSVADARAAAGRRPTGSATQFGVLQDWHGGRWAHKAPRAHRSPWACDYGDQRRSIGGAALRNNLMPP